MAIDAGTLFESLIEKQLRLSYYKEIMQAFRQVDVSTDRDFQRAYIYFYRVRRGVEWQQKYFCYMESCKRNPVGFDAALSQIYSLTGNVEPSFTSKLLATLDDSSPIIDSIVLNRLGLQIAGNSKREKICSAVSVYCQLQEWYAAYLQTDEAAANIAAFDSVLPSYSWISDTKKIDFLMWGQKK